MSDTVLYSANLVFPVTSPRIVGGAVAVRDGKVLHVGERSWVRQTLRERGLSFVEEHHDGVIAPGLVNAHTHLQYTHMAELASRRYSGFEEWGDAFDVVYAASGHDWFAAAAAGARLSLAAGVTAAADVVTDREALSALHDAGMRGICFWEVYGKRNEDWHARARAEVRRELRGIPGPPGAGVSPHAPYSLDVQPLLELPDIVREEGLRLHIHLAEAHIEREFAGLRARVDGSAGVAGGGSGVLHAGWHTLAAESLQALRRLGVGVSSTQFVDHLGVLGPDCHIAHGVYVSAEDRSLLRARGTSVALCPRSNLVIGLDMPPVAAYLREGNLVAVGTDSLSSSPSLDLLADVGLLYCAAREQGYGGADLHQRLFAAATLGGAQALGLHVGGQRIGQLAAHAHADLAFFEVASGDVDDALAELVEDGAGKNVRTVLGGVTVFSR